MAFYLMAVFCIYISYLSSPRMDELNLNRLMWWKNQYQVSNFTLSSQSDCDFHNIPIQHQMYLSPHHIFYGYGTQVNVLESSSTEIIPNYSKKLKRIPPPAIQIQDISINIHSIFEPVIDINASGIIINVVTEKDKISITPMIEVPVTIVKVGHWTLDELVNMLPPPPKEAGLYPRLGTVNLTNVKILSHSIEGNVTSLNEIDFPDEFFYPLYQLTNLAGVNGTDQTFIPTVIKKSIIMVLRKHTINEDGFISKTVSKTMESFLLNMQKSSEFMQEVTDLMQLKIHEWTGIIDDGIEKVSKTLHQFIVKVEADWNEAMKAENNPFSKFSKDAKNVWEGIDDFLSKAGQTVQFTLDKVEKEINKVTMNGIEEVLPQISKNVKNGWNSVKTSLKEVEDGLNDHVRNIEKGFEDISRVVIKDIPKGLDDSLSKVGHSIKASLKEAEDEVNARAKKIDEMLEEVSKDAIKGISKTTQNLFRIFME